MAFSDTVTTDTPSADAAPAPPQGGFSKKTLAWIGGVTVLVWAFAINTGSTVLLIIVSVLTALMLALLGWAYRMMRKQRRLVDLLQGAAASPEARGAALAQLSNSKDRDAPINVFARAQLQANDDPKGAILLLERVELKTFAPAMQDDVSLLMTQLYLSMGRTQEARKAADRMNLDNPLRKEIRPLAAAFTAEAMARTGNPKEALALLDSIVLPAKGFEPIVLESRVARIFARFSANQRGPARAELIALADDDINHLGRFLLPQFRVHPLLQKLARSVFEGHPAARKQARGQRRR